ncbi:MAG: helix-turn-helix transcriptional regulator [Lachnospiraceae bacterium]|nr:helix-turn-helix transcriptional regulator [Lachnospiraceae bacterium]
MIRIPYAGYNYYHESGWEINRPNGTSFYSIIMIRNPFYYEADGGTLYVDRPAFLFFRPADPEHFYLRSAPYTDDWVHLQADDGELDELFEKMGLTFARALTVYDHSEASAIMQNIAAEVRRSSDNHDMIMDSLARLLIYKIGDLSKVKEEPDFKSGTLESYRSRINVLRGRIYQGGEAARIGEVSELASEMNMSVSYFQHIYKALYGVPVTRDLIAARIEYAIYLLRNRNLSVAEAASVCGYETIEHFNRQFKKEKGCSPTDYMKEHRNS